MAFKIKEEIYHLIKNDVKLRIKMAAHLGVSDSTIYIHAARQAPKLYDYNLIRILREHTGREESEIFETV